MQQACIRMAQVTIAISYHTFYNVHAQCMLLYTKHAKLRVRETHHNFTRQSIIHNTVGVNGECIKLKTWVSIKRCVKCTLCITCVRPEGVRVQCPFPGRGFQIKWCVFKTAEEEGALNGERKGGEKESGKIKKLMSDTECVYNHVICMQSTHKVTTQSIVYRCVF